MCAGQDAVDCKGSDANKREEAPTLWEVLVLFGSINLGRRLVKKVVQFADFRPAGSAVVEDGGQGLTCDNRPNTHKHRKTTHQNDSSSIPDIMLDSSPSMSFLRLYVSITCVRVQ